MRQTASLTIRPDVMPPGSTNQLPARASAR